MQQSPRRLFLREVMRSVARTAADGHAAMGEVRAAALAPLTTLQKPGEEPAVDSPAAPPPLPPPTRMASRDELAALAADAGLATWVDDVLACARPSLRLVPTTRDDASGRSQLGGQPAGLPGDGWPQRSGRRLPLTAQLDIDELDCEWLAPDAPAGSVLLVFYDLLEPGTTDPDGLAVAVVEPDAQAADLDPAPAVSIPCVPVRVISELILPRVWTARVERLGLSPDEQSAWERLRRELAGAQGTTPSDLAAPHTVLHRMFGYPDEKSGDMPLACELLARGHDLGGAPPAAHQAAADAEAAAGRWRLLLQLHLGPLLDGAPFERLYLWTDPAAQGLAADGARFAFTR